MFKRSPSSGHNWKDSMVIPVGVAAIIGLTLAFVVRPKGSGLGVWYEEYAQIIRTGDILSSAGGGLTFPMWGYGYLLALTSNVAALILLQIVVGLASTVWVLLSLVDTEKIKRRSAVLGMWIVALFLPWHAVVASAYSAPALGASFMLIALGFLIRYLASGCGGYILLIMAVFAFGLSLNFRSDYFAFTLVITVIVVVAAPSWKRGAVGGGLWFAICAIMMAPWMLYTQSAVGRPLITSTNSGHVLFLSWGDFPNNPWGIHVTDSDPVMLSEIQHHFEEPVSSLSAEGDRYLKGRFFMMVRERPALYLRRMGIQIRNLLLGGFFPGVWDQEFRDRVRARFPNKNLNSILLEEWRPVLGLASSGTILTLIGEIQARLGFLLGIGLAVFIACRMIRDPDWVVVLLLMGIAYQLATSVVAHYIRPPLNNQIIPLVCLGLWWAENWRRSRSLL